MREPSWDDADPRPPYRGAPGPPPGMRGRAPGPRDRPDSARARRPVRGELPDPTRGRRPAPGGLPDGTRARPPDGWGRGTDSGVRGRHDERERGTGSAGRGRPDGRARGTGPNRPARGQRSQSASPLQWGLLPAGIGVCIVVGAALVGTMITVLGGSAPGLLLGVFTVAGTITGALAVRPRSAHVIVPVPALAYAVLATMAGLIHDQAAQSSTTALAVNLAQWVASGFVTIIISTAVAIGIAIVRRRGTPGAPGTQGTRRGPSGRGFSPSDRGVPPSDRGVPPSDRGCSPSDPDYPPPADRPARPRRPEGARSPSTPRRPDRDFDYPAPPASRGARDAGRYRPRDPGLRNPGPRDGDPWERERWYRTDSRLTAS